MRCSIVLLEDEHDSSNTARRCGNSCLVLIIPPVYFSPGLEENEIRSTEFRYRNRDYYGPAESRTRKTTSDDVSLLGCRQHVHVVIL